MRRVEKRIQEESNRVRETLHPSTLRPLLAVVEKAMIESHLPFFRSEFGKLLSDYQKEDLTRMYNLLHRVPTSGLPILRDEFDRHVTSRGMLSISSCDEKVGTDPALYVNTLLQVFKKYNILVEEAFVGDRGFAEALDRACIKYVNNNVVTQASRNMSKSPELLAKHCDALLRLSLIHI